MATNDYANKCTQVLIEHQELEIKELRAKIERMQCDLDSAKPAIVYDKDNPDVVTMYYC